MGEDKYLLDTDTFSYLVDGRRPEVRERVIANQNAIFISVITIGEALFGARRRQSKRLESLIALFREMFPEVSLEGVAADVYANIRLLLEQRGSPIGEMDLLIAAIAIAGDYVLVTNNTRHFSRIPGLRIENWVNE